MNVKNLAILFLAFTSFLCGKDEVTLQFKNGDTIPGSIKVLRKPSELQWTAPFFKDVMTVPTEQIASLEFPKSETVLPKGKKHYLIKTITGNVLHGDVTEISPDYISVSSLRHGQLKLLRKEIISLQLLDDYWQYSITNKGNWNHHLWDKGTNAELITKLRNAKLSGSMLLTEKFRIHLHLKWKNNPRFAFKLTQEAGAIKPGLNFSLETWEDNLVSLLGNDFELVKKLPQSVKGELQVTLYVNPKSATVEIVNAKGESIAKMQGKPGSTFEKFHFSLQNQSEQLVLRQLDVTNWKSKEPNFSRNASGFIDKDGEWVNGYLHTFQPSKKFLFVPGKPISESEAVQSIQFQPSPEKNNQLEQEVSFQFNDLTRISGKLTKLDDSMAYLKIPASMEPIPCKLNGIQFIKWNHQKSEAADPDEESDLLIWEKGQLNGILTPQPKEDFPLTWKPFFSSKSIPLSTNQSFSIQRKEVNPESLSMDKNTVLVHFRNKMEIPASIDQFGDNELTINSPILPKPTTYPTAHLRAIRFPLDNAIISSPESIHWTIDAKFSENYEIKDGKLHIFDRIEIKGPPTNGSLVKLNFEGIKNSEFTFGISNHKEGKTITPERNRSKIYIDKRRQYCSITRMRPNGTSSSSFSARKDTLDMEIKFENTLNLRVQNRLESLPLEETAYTILYVIPKEGNVVISSPEMIQAIRSIPTPSQLGKTLSLPRLSAKSPPPNIIIAPNGDTLRGTLLSIQSDQLAFRSMKRTLKIPLSRCSTILWMPPEDIPPAPIISQGNVRVILANGTILPMELESFKDGKLIGQSNDIGQCVVPFSAVKEVHFWQSGYLEPLDTFDHWQYTINEPKPLEN